MLELAFVCRRYVLVLTIISFTVMQQCSVEVIRQLGTIRACLQRERVTLAGTLTFSLETIQVGLTRLPGLKLGLKLVE